MRTLIPAIAAAASLAHAGPLTPPPGAPAPTNKTLNQIEPSIPVETLPGDADTLHIIDEPGHYHLTGNIEGANLLRIIEITTTAVTLDLRGFRVRGDSTVDAIIESNNINITVRNGTISGGDEFGLRLSAFGHIVEDISFGGAGAFFNQDGVGLSIGRGSRVSGCTFGGSGRVTTGNAVLITDCTFDEARNAFVLANGCVMRDVTIDGDRDSGPEPVITAGRACLFERVSVSNTFRPGLAAGAETTVASCSFRNLDLGGSGPAGISVGANSLVLDTGVEQFGVDGIAVGNNSIVSRCVVSDQSGDGIDAGFGAIVDRCTIANCAAGLTGSGITAVRSHFRDNDVGIDAGEESIIEGCRISSSGTRGMTTSFACRIRLCTFRGSASNVVIQGGDCVVEHNLFDSTALAVEQADNVIDGNTFTDPPGAALSVNAANNLVIRNRINGGITNFFLVGGNTAGAFTNNAVSAGPFDNILY